MNYGKISGSILISSLIMSLSSPSTVLAKENQIYKWTDEKGVIHYGDIKPGGVETEVLRIKPGKSMAIKTSPQQKAKKIDKAYEKKKAALDEQAKLAQQTSKKNERCQQARRNLEIMKSNGRVRVNENGKLRYLSPEEMAAQQLEMNKIIKESCK